MKSRCGSYGLISLAVGLLISQILFSLQLYAANLRLYERTIAMADAGYMVVPNASTAADLTKVGAAFYGALFFSLSVGAVLSIGALASAWVWDRLTGRRRIFLFALCIPWSACIAAVNLKGFCPWITAIFLTVPATSFLLAIRRMPVGHFDRRRVVLAFLPVAALAGMWLFQLDPRMMIDIRDGLLLSNPVGRKINDFYYRYTLYPAEVFKSLDQKLIKTVGFDSSVEPPLQAELEKRLVNYDYLKIPQEDLCDLWIRQTGDRLILENNAKVVAQISAKTFCYRMLRYIGEFSKTTDRWPFYRSFTFISILIGLPILCYLCIYGLTALIARGLRFRHSSYWASGVCLGAGLVLLAFFHASRPGDMKLSEISAALNASRWQDRVGALKLVVKDKLEIADYPVYSSLLSSEYDAERYWLVKCLGISQNPETYAVIQDFLEDPHINVACMAFQALGRRNNPDSQQIIVSRIGSLRHYYVQWYAYKALRSLGWKPERSME